MAHRRLFGRLIFLVCVAILLVPAIWERYQRDFMQVSVAVPPPPRPFVSLESADDPVQKPDTREYFSQLYSVTAEKQVESDLPSLDELTTETPRAWVLELKRFDVFSAASKFDASLRMQGFNSFVTPNNNDIGPFFVMVGPFLDYSRTLDEQKRVRGALSLDAAILKFKP